jgi:hypothetical protein
MLLMLGLNLNNKEYNSFRSNNVRMNQILTAFMRNNKFFFIKLFNSSY